MMTEQVRPRRCIDDGNVESIVEIRASITMTYPYFPVFKEDDHVSYNIVKDLRRNRIIDVSPINGVFRHFVPNDKAVFSRPSCNFSCLNTQGSGVIGFTLA